MRHFPDPAPLRHERPAPQRAAGGRILKQCARQGRASREGRRWTRTAEHRGAVEKATGLTAALIMGPPGGGGACRERRPGEVEVSAVQRHARRRLRVRPRHGRRQGTTWCPAHGDAGAEASERPLDRDVISLRNRRRGRVAVRLQFMANQHFPEIDAEYCLAEGGGVTRMGGEVKFRAGAKHSRRFRMRSSWSRPASRAWLGRS